MFQNLLNLISHLMYFKRSSNVKNLIEIKKLLLTTIGLYICKSKKFFLLYIIKHLNYLRSSRKERKIDMEHLILYKLYLRLSDL